MGYSLYNYLVGHTYVSRALLVAKDSIHMYICNYRALGVTRVDSVSPLFSIESADPNYIYSQQIVRVIGVRPRVLYAVFT